MTTHTGAKVETVGGQMLVVDTLCGLSAGTGQDGIVHPRDATCKACRRSRALISALATWSNR